MDNAAKFREPLADLQHQIWSDWMRWVFKICPKDEQGRVLIPAELVERWNRQISTAYCDLSYEEKENDRREADKVLAVLNSIEQGMN